ncbi:DUF5677 domain-containing protein [Stenotrophomonas sp. BR163]|uniref:DUF5677 domain-containing protein n=1 Tax=Stenotrophomonas sp. BR163 TaxID=3398459 RepID=UPI0039C63929
MEMHHDQLLQIERDRSSKALELMRELLQLTKPIAVHPRWSHEERSLLAMLLTSSARSTESVFLLCSYGQLWDAEMVLRAVAEATLKTAYILQSEDEFKARVAEYSTDHFNISLLKDDSKLRSTLAALSEPDSREWLPLRERLLSEEELDELGRLYDKTKRRSIESRWGVGGLLNSLRKDAPHRVPRYDALLHNYSLSSHIQHADYIGISLPYDRQSRDEERRDALELAHLSRLISDCFSLMYLRIVSGYRFLDLDLKPILDGQKRVDEMGNGFGNPFGEWMKVEYGEDESSE